MWIYEKKLEFPVKITKPDAREYKPVAVPRVCPLMNGI